MGSDTAFAKRLEALEIHMKSLQEEKTSAGAEKDAYKERYETERFKGGCRNSPSPRHTDI